MPYTGELAALTTAFLWSFTSLFFTSASRRIGSYWVNKIRILFAVILLAATLIITTGRLLPSGIPARSYYYLILSGIIGLSIGDLFLFSAFVALGPRLTLLIFSASPILTAVIAWLTIGEKLGTYAIFGILLTVGGIVWVTAERGAFANGNNSPQKKSLKWGILFAIGGAVGQAVGLVLAKEGMGSSLEALPATFIRMISAVTAIWLFGLFRGDTKEVLEKIKNKRAVLLAFGGSVCGPFLGVWMSLVSIRYTETGIAAAIMATVPVLVIPLVIFFYKEKVSPRAFIGALLTAGGVAILFLQ